ncbi:hypothetical protein [Frigoribacterium sp. Leaf172]|uniref:hypothetical protein n=1 Tax=Frigoribacterium sp. Leaf172 TaxID=1736285 RepID=UPI000A612F57|nr:hypothetical protein [Frigoribacterium sp. Leaf172]
MFESKTVVAICAGIILVVAVLIWIQMTGALAVFFDHEPEEDYAIAVLRSLSVLARAS